MSTKDSLELFMSFFTVVGIIWRVSKTESAIYIEIDRIKDDLKERIINYERRLELHILEANKNSGATSAEVEKLSKDVNKLKRIVQGYSSR